MASRRTVLLGLMSAAEVAVLYGQRTADHYGRDESKGRYLAHYRGVYAVLTHGHIAFDVLADPAWTADRFSAYRALVLPNAACLSAEEAAALDEFVESGGALIATHETALYDPDGHHRGDFVLRCLGRRFVKRRVMQSAYLRIRDKALFGPDLAETDLFGLGLEQPYGGFGPLAPEHVGVDVPGAEAEFIFTERAAENVQVPGRRIACEHTEDLFLTAPVTNNVPEFAYWEGETNTPGLTVNRYGRGRAYYLPWQVARQYHLYGLPTCELLLARLAEAAIGRRTLWTDAPRAVEIVHGRRPDGSLVLHLINSAGLESKPLLDAAPLGPLHVQVERPIRTAKALVSGIDLPVQQDGARACVTLPRLGLFEVVHLE